VGDKAAEGAVNHGLQTLRQKDRPIDSVGERLLTARSPPKGQALHRQRESLR
jgi:hypothetical protein